MNIPFSFRITDNSGNLVSGATIMVGNTTLIGNTTSPLTPTYVPQTAGMYGLCTLAQPTSGISVILLNYGTGDYSLLYDPITQGELYIPLTVSATGSTISEANAVIPIIAKNTTLNTIVDGAVSVLDLLIGQTGYILGNYSVSITGESATITYYRQDGETTALIYPLTLNGNAQAVSRTVTFVP